MRNWNSVVCSMANFMFLIHFLREKTELHLDPLGKQSTAEPRKSVLQNAGPFSYRSRSPQL